MNNYDNVCYVEDESGIIHETVQGTSIITYLPSDAFGGLNNPYDTDTWYYQNDSTFCAPSPYKEDDSRNPEYYRTSSPSDSTNALSDFKGKENTKILTDLATAQSDWKTASSIENQWASGYYPAACCCWRYHTEGTKQGDWYLPSMGELGYIMPKYNKINETITKLINGYDESDVGVILARKIEYWSSSECFDLEARIIDPFIGTVDTTNMSYAWCARACLRVK